ncbi:Smt3-specific protease [Ascosphaera acerosa]|nr:Smt3-specific protease [Ascosphaera acerosa]
MFPGHPLGWEVDVLAKPRISRGKLAGSFPAARGASFPLRVVPDAFAAAAESARQERKEWAEDVPCYAFHYRVFSDDKETLAGSRSWLSNSIVCLHLELLRRALPPAIRSSFGWIDSAFTSVLRDEGLALARMNDGYRGVCQVAFSRRLLVFPLQQHDHWTLLAVDVERRSFIWGDSMAGQQSPRVVAGRVGYLLAWLDLVRGVSGGPSWRFLGNPFPRQRNGYDCGVFVLAGALLVALAGRVGEHLRFSAADVSGFRQRIRDELTLGRFAFGFEELVAAVDLTVN